jgi:hypothetical protein
MRRRGISKRFGWLAAALLAWALGAPAAALAADQEGVVLEVQLQDGSFAVKGDDGASPPTIFRTDAKTRIRFEDKVVPFANLVPGDRVSVHYREQEVGPLATAIEIHRLRRAR